MTPEALGRERASCQGTTRPYLEERRAVGDDRVALDHVALPAHLQHWMYI